MLIIDFDRQLTFFAPGKCGSTALGFNLQELSTSPDQFFRAQRLKLISSNPIPAHIQELFENKEYYYSLPIADSYLMYRNLYKQPNFTHYVFYRDPVDRIISAFETLVYWYCKDKWTMYHNNETTLDELWETAQKLTDYDYHAGHYLTKIKNLQAKFTHISEINNVLKEHYNIQATHIPSVPLWTNGIDVDAVSHTHFTRESDIDLWDKTQLEMNRFRSDCAVKYSALLKNAKLEAAIKVYNSLDTV
jgi:hypothetical protein